MWVFAVLLLLGSLTTPAASVGCDACVDFMQEFEGDLLDLVLQIGISEGCRICGHLSSKTGQEVCGVLCEIVGIEAFVHILEKVDDDPVYVCTELLACPRNHCVNNCTSIQSVAVNPSSGPIGTSFKVTVTLKAFQRTGTGTTWLSWKCPVGAGGMTEAMILNTGFAAGSINKITYDIDTRNNQCLYSPQNYTVLALSCAYDCQDLHGEIYSAEKGQFVITNQ
jgi:hypothetical protein